VPGRFKTGGGEDAFILVPLARLHGEGKNDPFWKDPFGRNPVMLSNFGYQRSGGGKKKRGTYWCVTHSKIAKFRS